jgi:ABC-type Fe3+-hydroxamate transport system substrate-binding protein
VPIPPNRPRIAVLILALIGTILLAGCQRQSSLKVTQNQGVASFSVTADKGDKVCVDSITVYKVAADGSYDNESLVWFARRIDDPAKPSKKNCRSEFRFGEPQAGYDADPPTEDLQPEQKYAASASGVGYTAVSEFTFGKTA